MGSTYPVAASHKVSKSWLDTLGTSKVQDLQQQKSPLAIARGLLYMIKATP